jgi:hypothetical protein
MPVELRAAGSLEKAIYEYVGRMRAESEISVARMVSPAGWSEPGQRPEFREITLVLSGALRVENENGVETIGAGQAYISEKRRWVRYSTPDEPAEYVAICVPAFSPSTVHRDHE